MKIWWIFAPALLFAQAEYRGTTAPDMIVPQTHLDREFKLATADLRKPLGEVSGQVFAGKVGGAPAFVVEGASTTLYVDTDGLRKYELQPYDSPLIAGVADVRFPLPGPVYKYYPVRVYVYRPQKKPNSRMVGESPRAFVRGSAAINGQSVQFAFEFDRKQNRALADNGWQGVNGEYTFLKDERPVYRAAGAYFSVRSIDLERREFILDARTAADYTRIDLKIGETFPDFSFTDFEGRAHKLSDYAGKRVLLDFWATWCAPCVADIPKLRELNARGLSIIGMNVDEDPQKPRALGLPWAQAAFPSIRDIVERRARIEVYPTYLLLDGDRQIVAAGEYALK